MTLRQKLQGLRRRFVAPPTPDRRPGPAYLAGVSWPRSGHHLLMRLLEAYLGPSFGYCEFYEPEDCCKTFPCARAGRINVSKNHDDHFRLPQRDDINYLIQVRDFIPALISNFELHVREGNGPDTAEEFRLYASKQWTRYRKFMRKWVESGFASRQLVVDYAWLVDDPVAVVATTLRWLDPAIRPDTARLKEIVRSITGISHDSSGAVETGAGVRVTRVPETFRHYDPDLFDLLGKLVLGRTEAIKVHREVLGREPDEADMLALQCHASPQDLRRALEARQRG